MVKRNAVPWFLTFILVIRTIIKLIVIILSAKFLGRYAAWVLFKNILGIISIWVSYYIYKKFKERRNSLYDYNDTLF